MVGRRSTAVSRRSSAKFPLISGYDNLRALVRADFIAGFREMFDQDRLARFVANPRRWSR